MQDPLITLISTIIKIAQELKMNYKFVILKLLSLRKLIKFNMEKEIWVLSVFFLILKIVL